VAEMTPATIPVREAARSQVGQYRRSCHVSRIGLKSVASSYTSIPSLPFNHATAAYVSGRRGRLVEDFHDPLTGHGSEQQPGGTEPAKASATKTVLSSAWPTTVEPIVRVQSQRPRVKIFIFARTKELANSPARYPRRGGQDPRCPARGSRCTRLLPSRTARRGSRRPARIAATMIALHPKRARSRRRAAP